MRFALIIFDLKQNKIVFNIDKRYYLTYAVGKFLDISVLNCRAENCLELPRLALVPCCINNKKNLIIFFLSLIGPDWS